MNGINLAERHKHIQRIVTKNFSASAHGAGVEIEDLVQDVFVKLVRTNRGNHPYNPGRGSFASYVYLVAQSVLRKTIRKKTRMKRPQGVPVVIADEQQDQGGLVLPDLHHDPPLSG